MPDLNGLIPYVEVFDMIASVAFYRDILGFAVLFASPEVETAEGRFSHFVRMGRGRAEIMLNTAYDSNERPTERSEARWAGCRHIHFYIDCDDVAGLHTEIVEKGGDPAPPASTGRLPRRLRLRSRRLSADVPPAVLKPRTPWQWRLSVRETGAASA